MVNPFKGWQKRTKFQQAKRRAKLRDKWFWRNLGRKRKKDNYILKHILTGICPKCHAGVRHKNFTVQANPVVIYSCRNCDFHHSIPLDDDEDDFSA